jgi:type I restriction enzyme S subunit
MIDKRKVPEIRFKGFDGEWEERTLNEVSESIEYGLNASAIEFDDHNKYLRITDIDDASRLFSTANLTSPNVDLSLAEKYRLTEGDILFARTGASVGKTYIYKQSDGLVYYAGFLIRARIRKAYSPEYIFSNTLTIGYKNFVKFTSQRSGQPGINAQEYGDYIVTLPSKVEQSQIGTFFQSLDSLITLHQRKYDKLTSVKKAMLEKMFPKDGADVPEIRFKGFTEKWERRQLGEIVTEIRRPIELKDEHEYELVTVKRRNEGVISRGKLKGRDILVKTYFELQSGDYIISKRQVVHGANGVVPQCLDKTIVSNEYLVAVGNERITTDFFALFSKLPHMYKKFFLSSYGIDIEKLVFDVVDWKKRFVFVPCLSEQQRISSLFQSLDSLITLQQRELDKLKNIKKACLEKMFV